MRSVTRSPPEAFSIVLDYNIVETPMASDHERTLDGTPTAPESSPGRVHRRYRVAASLPPEQFGEVLVVSAESADRVLTPKRRELIDALASYDVDSQRELADRLDRDPGNVKRDLAVLIDEGVVAREKEGRSYRPYLKYDTVIAEPTPTVDT